MMVGLMAKVRGLPDAFYGEGVAITESLQLLRLVNLETVILESNER